MLHVATAAAAHALQCFLGSCKECFPCVVQSGDDKRLGQAASRRKKIDRLGADRYERLAYL